MSTGTGWQVPCRHASSNITTFQCGYRGMDDMHSPRATTLHVNAHCGTPEINEMSCNPRGYTPNVIKIIDVSKSRYYYNPRRLQELVIINGDE